MSLLPVLPALLLAGCGSGDTPGARLEDYVTRIERVAGPGVPADPPPALQVYPRARARVMALGEIRIDFLELLDYWRCNLGVLIGERNSGLGKVMAISTRLRYELKFLQRAGACARRVSDEPDEAGEFREAIAEVVRFKRAQLPRVYWNATLGSPEMAAAFGLDTEPLGDAQDAAYVKSRDAIEYLHALGRRLAAPDLNVDPSVMESHYQALQRHRYGGRALRAVSEAGTYLDRAASALEGLTAGGPLCRAGTPVPKALILETVFRKFYVARLGRYVSRLHTRTRAWLAEVDALIGVQRVRIPESFAAYRRQMLSLDEPGSVWGRFSRANRRHVRAWRIILEQCGLAPGVPGS